ARRRLGRLMIPAIDTSAAPDAGAARPRDPVQRCAGPGLGLRSGARQQLGWAPLVHQSSSRGDEGMAKNERALMLAIALLTSSVAQAQDGGSDATPTDPPSGPSGSPVGAADRPDEDAGDDDEAPSYGDAGTWELGGSVGGLWTEDVFTLNVRPSVGLFL